MDFSYSLKGVKPNFTQFQDVIDFLDASSKTERLIVIFDEFPLFATAIEDSMGKLQRYIDFHKDNANLKIVLCGSSLSFMKTQIDDKASPLYGRKTAQIYLKAFSLSQIAQLTNRSKLEDIIKIFSVTGGIAKYVALFANKKNCSIEEIIEELFFSLISFLSEEAIKLLQMEVRDTSSYEIILKLIANGVNQNSKLSDKSGFSTSLIS